LRELGCDLQPAATRGARDEIGKAMIGLGPDDDVDDRRAARDLRSLGLCDAAGDGDDRFPARRAPQHLGAPHAPQL